MQPLTNKAQNKIYDHCLHTIIIIKKFLTFFLQNIRLSTNSISFNDKKIKKSDFYNKHKKIFNLGDIDVNKILVSKKE